jgi:signal transduction histidine kinase
LIERAFHHRSGRVIAVSRFVLAAVFLLAIWIDPSQPAKYGFLAYAVLGFYTLISAILIVATWSSWWADFRLSKLAHVFDIIIFSASVFLTEGYNSSFTSPFFTFFLFILFSATVRWGWKSTVRSALAVVAAYVAMGLLGFWVEVDYFDTYRFARRTVYLVLLSAVMIWFGINQMRPRTAARAPELEVRPDAIEPPVVGAAAYAARRLRGGRVLFIWWENEEPWINVVDSDGAQCRQTQFGPAELGPEVDGLPLGEPFLFDRNRNRSLFAHSGDATPPKAARIHVQAGLLERFAMSAGIGIPVRSAEFEGELFVLDIPGSACDDLALGHLIADEVSAALDRYSVIRAGERAAVGRAEASLARDLHDSVAQVLAGAMFRLDAAHASLRGGQDPVLIIDEVRGAIKSEQATVRGLINRLRSGPGSNRIHDFGDSLAKLCDELKSQWLIECSVLGRDSPILVPGWMHHELHHIVREAVANAVRHGFARSVTLHLVLVDEFVKLRISDNGRGFSADPKGFNSPVKNTKPWSINERLRGLGGSLSLYSGKTGSTLEILVPRSGDE